MPYFFLRHEAVSPKDLYDYTIDNSDGLCFFSSVADGVLACKRSPRVQEAIRLNKLLDPNYKSLYVVRPICNITYEYRVLIIDAKVHTIIPTNMQDLLDDNSIYHRYLTACHNIAKKITTYMPYDNYCCDIIVVDDKALLLECNPLLHGVTDLYPMHEMIDLRNI